MCSNDKNTSHTNSKLNDKINSPHVLYVLIIAHHFMYTMHSYGQTAQYPPRRSTCEIISLQYYNDTSRYQHMIYKQYNRYMPHLYHSFVFLLSLPKMFDTHEATKKNRMQFSLRVV